MLSVALLKDHEMYCFHEEAPRLHDQLILTQVEDLLKQAVLQVKDLDLIVCGVGPGSFMGVRLAVSVAQGLAFPYQTPIVALSSLETMASGSDFINTTRVISVLDARMGEFYIGGYELDADNQVQCFLQDQIIQPGFNIPLEHLPCAVIGCDDFVVRDHCEIKRGASLCYPNATDMLTLGYQKFQISEFLMAKDLAPCYLRQAVSD